MNIEKIDAQDPDAEPESLPEFSADDIPGALLPVLKTLGGDEQGHTTMEDMTALMSEYMMDSGNESPGNDQKVTGRRKFFVQDVPEADTAVVYYHSGVDDDDWLRVSASNARAVVSNVLTEQDYGAIRTAIGFYIDDEVIPDSVLEQPIFVPASEMEIRKLVTNADQLTGDNLFCLKNAIIYWTAYKLLLSFPQLVEQVVLSERLRWQPVDWEKKLEFLLRERNRCLSMLNVNVDVTRVFSLGDGYKDDLRREMFYSGYWKQFPELYRYNEYLDSLGDN